MKNQKSNECRSLAQDHRECILEIGSNLAMSDSEAFLFITLGKNEGVLSPCVARVPLWANCMVLSSPLGMREISKLLSGSEFCLGSRKKKRLELVLISY